MKRVIYVLIPILVLGGLIGWRFVAKGKEKAEQDRTAKARKTAAPGVRVPRPYAVTSSIPSKASAPPNRLSTSTT